MGTQIAVLVASEASLCAMPIDRGLSNTSPDRVHVLFIVNTLNVGGAEKHTVTLLNGLDPRCFRLSLVSLKPGERLLSGLRPERADSLVPIKSRSRVDFDCARRLGTFIAAEGVHVVVCTNTYSTLYGYLGRRYSGRDDVKLISVYHSTLLRTAKERLQHLLYRWVLRRCDQLIYVCESQRAYWRSHKLRAREDRVIHNGVDTNYFADRLTAQEKAELRRRAGFGADDYVIGICAAFRPEKAHGDLLKAVAGLRRLGLPAKALLIGDGRERSRIEKEVRALDLGEHVYITGLQNDVRPWIASADVMTVVSHAIETFSLASLEAMALGKPLVMSNIGGASEQVIDGETGYLFDAGDIGKLTTRLAELHAAPLRTRMGAAGLRRVREKFTLERMLDAFESLLAPAREPRAAASSPTPSVATRI